MRPLPAQYRDRCAFITTFYESPFERVFHWAWQDKHADNWLWDAIGRPFDVLDARWRRWYARHPKRTPHPRWARHALERQVYLEIGRGR